MSRATVTVVIPVHNEAEILAPALEVLFGQLESVDADVSVYLVENGSTDDTYQRGMELSDRLSGLSVMKHYEPDYGASMRAGFLAATGDWVVNFDIDYFSGPFLTTVLTGHEEADIVIASKRVIGSEDRRSMLRRLGTFGFNRLLRILFGSSVSDTHGMKAFRADVVAEFAPRVVSRKDLFDTELVLRAERAGRRIDEVPVVVEELREARSSFLARVPRTLRGLWEMRQILKAESAGA
jgi:glycosyltransferase involved in cell wall biosynthesis